MPEYQSVRGSHESNHPVWIIADEYPDRHVGVEFCLIQASLLLSEKHSSSVIAAVSVAQNFLRRATSNMNTRRFFLPFESGKRSASHAHELGNVSRARPFSEGLNIHFNVFHRI